MTIIDPSESLDPNKQLCHAVQVAWEGLDPERLRTMVVAEQGNPVFCSDGTVDDIHPLSPTWTPETSIDTYEDWGMRSPWPAPVTNGLQDPGCSWCSPMP